MKKMKVVIMAGGNGTRLWPMSTRSKPKQFQALASDQTMLQETYSRMSTKYDHEDLFVATSQGYADLVAEQLPDIPKENIILETSLRDTASAIALIAGLIAKKDPEATVAIFPSDHVIENSEVLLSALDAAHKYIDENAKSIVTFGILPTHPDSGYGYIKKGEAVAGMGDDTVFTTERFVEKPDLETASKYLDEGGYYWNAGMFVFQADEMLKKYKAFVPDTHKRIMTIQDAVGTDKFDAVLTEQYAGMDKISVDYAIMENATTDIRLIPLALSWSDVGDWARLKETVVSESDQHMSKGEHIDFNSRNTIVFANQKPVVTVGLEDMVVVDTPEALLVCTQSEAANLSKYVKEMGAGKYEHLL